MKNKALFKNILKFILLIIILISSYFICVILFFSNFGTGGQSSQAIKQGYGFLIIILPILITTIIGYKLFSKKNKQ